MKSNWNIIRKLLDLFRFNFVAKRLYRRLLGLGATALLERGDGNDQDPQGYQTALSPWLKCFWSVVLGSDAIPEELVAEIEPAAEIEFSNEKVNDARIKDCWRVIRNDRITAPGHFQSVRHFSVQSNSQVLSQYRPGDVAVVQPSNDPQIVARILEQLGWESWADRSVQRIHSSRPDLPQRVFHFTNLTIRQILQDHLDLSKPPQSRFFAILADLYMKTSTFSEMVLEKLSELATNIDSYTDYIIRPRRRPDEVLGDFRMISKGTVSINFLFDLFPSLIRPRMYSIAGADKSSLDLCVAVTEYRTPFLAAPRRGLCSSLIDAAEVGYELPLERITFRRGSIRLPDDQQPCALVFMASGTGIAPIRAILQHLKNHPPGCPVYLFFGCRYLTQDCHYREEFSDKSVYPWLTYLPVGSRDGPNKIYLQDWLRSHADLLRPLLWMKRSYFYLCGNTRLARPVLSTLKTIASETTAKGLLDGMIAEGRLQMETWS